MQFIFALTLILWGCSIIIGTIFGINIPFLRLLFAGLLIYYGVRLLTKRTFFGCSTTYGRHTFNTWSQTTEAESDNQATYNVYFGTKTIDLRTVTLAKKPTTLTINIAFSNAIIILDAAVPTLIQLNGTFTNVQLPSNKKPQVFQMEPNVYRTHEGIEAELILNITANFSNIELRTFDTEKA
jgi:hypothetical protein